MAKKKIILHGYLKKLAPQGLEFEATTAKEAIEGLCRQVKAFQGVLGQAKHKVRILGFRTAESLVVPTDEEVLHLMPVLGGGKSGFFQIVIGAVLIAVAIWNPMGIAALTIAGSTTVGSVMFSVGLALVLGGVAQMLSPAPSIDTTSDPEASKILPTQQNTVKIGTRIPLGYGRHKVYGHYLSFNVQSTDVITGTLS